MPKEAKLIAIIAVVSLLVVIAYSKYGNSSS